MMFNLWQFFRCLSRIVVEPELSQASKPPAMLYQLWPEQARMLRSSRAVLAAPPFPPLATLMS